MVIGFPLRFLRMKTTHEDGKKQAALALQRQDSRPPGPPPTVHGAHKGHLRLGDVLDVRPLRTPPPQRTPAAHPRAMVNVEAVLAGSQVV